MDEYQTNKINNTIINLNIETMYHVINDTLQLYYTNNDGMNIIHHLQMNKDALNYDVGDLYNYFIISAASKHTLDINLDAVSTPEELYNIASSLYEILISGNLVIIKDFIINYIETNKNSLIHTLELDKVNKKSKNIMTLNNEAMQINSDDNLIVTNLDKVIRYILQFEISTSDFLSISNKKYLIDSIGNYFDIYNDFNIVEYYKSLLNNNIMILNEMMVNIRYQYYNINNGGMM